MFQIAEEDCGRTVLKRNRRWRNQIVKLHSYILLEPVEVHGNLEENDTADQG